MSHYDKLNILVQEINNNPIIEVPYSIVLEGITKEEILQFQTKFKLNIEKSLMSFFLECSYVQIEWELKSEFMQSGIEDFDPDEKISGALFIPDLNSILGGFDGEGWEDTLWLKGGKVKEKIYYPFDLGISEEVVCLKMEDKNIKNNLYIMSIYENEVIDMQIGVEKYIDLILQSKGFEFWQRAYINYDSEVNERLKNYLPKIFKNSAYKLSDFK